MTQKLKFGEVWLADLNPRFGTEPGKVRPVLIAQSQALLDVRHPSVIVIPLSTNLVEDAEPLRLRINKSEQLERDSDLLMDQIRSIDANRLTKGPLFVCDIEFMRKVQNALLELIGYEREEIKKVLFYE